MNSSFENVKPSEIEKRSFEIITQELGQYTCPEEQQPIIKRVIHTTADFDYASSLTFSDNVITIAKNAIKNGASIITDTQMAKAGINKKLLSSYGGEAFCFMSDEDIASKAASMGTTRAWASMEKAAELKKDLIFAIGNAPTALIRLHSLINEGLLSPVLIIGVPVGFVNVVYAKELILSGCTPYIINQGRKGGSNVAAAICNALLYEIKKDTE